ncbi:hypothetical protein VIGAN_07160000 [Vigna angularis var. angularis]|uniref:Uncharacterized protein n=1 Tax=Vigna angularis var. angularis TaxID=157739 RepID=A0A0S3SJ03_PHAAN|nr:hypothetical protein VIGAN_07160000 [Vigna angularis var. angularis]
MSVRSKNLSSVFLTTMLFIVLNSVPLLASPATISCTYVWATWQGFLYVLNSLVRTFVCNKHWSQALEWLFNFIMCCCVFACP